MSNDYLNIFQAANSVNNSSTASQNFIVVNGKKFVEADNGWYLLVAIAGGVALSHTRLAPYVFIYLLGATIYQANKALANGTGFSILSPITKAKQ